MYTHSSIQPGPSIESFEEGEKIFTAGTSAKYFYILLNGCVVFTKKHEPEMRLSGRKAFGVEGIISSSGVYSCSALAEKPCRVAKYNADIAIDMLQSTSRTMQVVIQGLAHLLEQSWSKPHHKELSELQTQFVGQIQTFGPGQWIMQDGEQGQEIYRIISSDRGLEVVKNGNRLAVISEPGDIFGEMASLLNENRSAGIRSIGNSVLEIYSPEQLTSMLCDYPEFSLRLVVTLAQRLARTTRELADLKKKDE